eukprot:7890635-Prorocentrum_lima.AAC.1
MGKSERVVRKILAVHMPHPKNTPQGKLHLAFPSRVLEHKTSNFGFDSLKGFPIGGRMDGSRHRAAMCTLPEIDLFKILISFAQNSGN